MSQQQLFSTVPTYPNRTAMPDELSVLLSHGSVEWYTPPEYVELAKNVMGQIDLDPASHPYPQEWIQAAQFFTIRDNGLNRQWFGKVWLNPPYSKTGGKSNQELWAQKLIREYDAGRVSEAVLLVKAAIGYKWFDWLFERYPVCFLRGLIRFIRPQEDNAVSVQPSLFSGDVALPRQGDGDAKLGSAFFYFGNNLQRFHRVFGEVGKVVR